MTLRARIAIALAVVAGLTAVFVAVTTYVSTDQRLSDEIDQSLDQYASRLAGPQGVSTCGRFGDGDDDLGGSLGGPPSRHEAFEGLRDSGVVVQCVAASGVVVRPPGQVALPVDDTDLALAEGSGRVRRTVSVDGVPYRMETVGVGGGFAAQIARDYSETERVLDGLRNWLIVIVVGATGVAAAAGWLIAWRATRPLVRLTDAAEEVATTGRLDVEVPPAGSDEPGRLARAFATMLAALGQSRDQQQQLVQDAGHELRTPLTSLRTNVETLRRHQALPPATRDAILADLDSETRELGSLVDELVQLATDTYNDEPEQTVALDQLVARVVERARRRTGRIVALDAAATTVVGQPRVLARAVGNLVDNAAKFSPEGTPIEVRVGGGVVTVRDHGPGVAAADRQRVFERFYRAADARSRPGSGLGLSIVAQAVQAHGGSVAVGDAPGGGAVFTISVPVPDSA